MVQVGADLHKREKCT